MQVTIWWQVPCLVRLYCKPVQCGEPPMCRGKPAEGSRAQSLADALGVTEADRQWPRQGDVEVDEAAQSGEAPQEPAAQPATEQLQDPDGAADGAGSPQLQQAESAATSSGTNGAGGGGPQQQTVPQSSAGVEARQDSKPVLYSMMDGALQLEQQPANSRGSAPTTAGPQGSVQASSRGAQPPAAGAAAAAELGAASAGSPSASSSRGDADDSQSKAAQLEAASHLSPAGPQGLHQELASVSHAAADAGAKVQAKTVSSRQEQLPQNSPARGAAAEQQHLPGDEAQQQSAQEATLPAEEQPPQSSSAAEWIADWQAGQPQQVRTLC